MTDHPNGACAEIMEDGAPCGLPITHTVEYAKGEQTMFCEECASYVFENDDDAVGLIAMGDAAITPAEAEALDIAVGRVKPKTDAPVKAASTATPQEHSSVVGGSTASRRLNCPRSYALEQIAPPDKGSSYAREGTALHEMIAIVVGENRDPQKLLPFTHKQPAKGAEEPWELTIDANLWADLGQPALDAFDAFVAALEEETGEEAVIQVEQRCAMPGIDDAFGTTDVIIRCGPVTAVWDWKFGRTPVSADSDQLRFYGRAAAYSYPEMFGAEKWAGIDKHRRVILAIMQPQVSDEPSLHETVVAELEAFRLDLVDAVKEAVDPGEAHCQKGSWCSFARCKSVCPLHVGQSMALYRKMTAVREAQAEQETPSLRATTVDGVRFEDMLPDLLDLAETAKDFADTVMKQAHAALEGGAVIAGWGLKHKRSSGRVFTVDDEAVKKFMKNRKYTMDDYMPRKMATMPQIETLLKRDGREMPEDMYEKKASSGTTLVRDGEGVATIANRRKRFGALAQKLNADGDVGGSDAE